MLTFGATIHPIGFEHKGCEKEGPNPRPRQLYSIFTRLVPLSAVVRDPLHRPSALKSVVFKSVICASLRYLSLQHLMLNPLVAYHSL